MRFRRRTVWKFCLNLCSRLFVWESTQDHSHVSIRQFLSPNVDGVWHESCGIPTSWWQWFYKSIYDTSVAKAKADLSSFHSTDCYVTWSYRFPTTVFRVSRYSYTNITIELNIGSMGHVQSAIPSLLYGRWDCENLWRVYFDGHSRWLGRWPGSTGDCVLLTKMWICIIDGHLSFRQCDNQAELFVAQLIDSYSVKDRIFTHWLISPFIRRRSYIDLLRCETVYSFL